MTCQELRDALEKLGLSQRAAANELGVEDRLMRYWCADQMPIPRYVTLALERLQQYKDHEARQHAALCEDHFP